MVKANITTEKQKKRHATNPKDSIRGMSKQAIRRLARRGGVKRVHGLVYEASRDALKQFLTRIIKNAVAYTEHAKRKTVTSNDVVEALKRNGKTIYGF